MKEKQAVTSKYSSWYQKVSKKEKATLLDEFTMLTSYHQKSAIRRLNSK